MIFTIVIVMMASLIVILIYLLHNNKCQLRELDEQQKMLRSSEARYKLITQKSNDIIFEYDLRGGYMVHCENFDTLLAVKMHCGFVEMMLEKGLIHPGDAELLHTALSMAIEEHGYAEAVMRIKANSDCYLWYQVSLVCIADDQGAPWRVVGRARDVDKQKREEKRLHEKATRDPLTKLLNKVAIRKEIDLALMEGIGKVHAFLIIDVDYFKTINDNNGHVVGDVVLTRAANGLRALFRSGDLLGRIGGDEMVVFCRDITSPEFAQNRADEVCALFRTLCDGDDKSIATSCSIGIAMAPRDGTCFKQLYVNADLALYSAKDTGRDRYRVYSPSMLEDTVSIND